MASDRVQADVSDALLGDRIRGGDREAFAQLFDRHGKTVYNYCFRRVGEWSVAEDIASQVFLTAWRKRDHFPSDQVLPWLYGIATNMVRNQRRSERRFRNAVARVARSAPERSERPIDSRLEDELQMKKVLELLNRLPRHEQDVFVLCGWMELSYADAAFALGVPIGTVRSRVARARAHMMELDPALRTYKEKH